MLGICWFVFFEGPACIYIYIYTVHKCMYAGSRYAQSLYVYTYIYICIHMHVYMYAKKSTVESTSKNNPANGAQVFSVWRFGIWALLAIRGFSGEHLQ